jgi:hypothetical protein
MKLETYPTINTSRLFINNPAEIVIKVPENTEVLFRFYYSEENMPENTAKYTSKELSENISVLKSISDSDKVNFYYEIYPHFEKTKVSCEELVAKIEKLILILDPSRI